MLDMPKLTPETQRQVAEKLREAATKARADGDTVTAGRQDMWAGHYRKLAAGELSISPDCDVENVLADARALLRRHRDQLKSAERSLGPSRELDESAMSVSPLGGINVTQCEPAVVRLIESLLADDDEAMQLAAVAATRGLSKQGKEQLRPTMAKLAAHGGTRTQWAAERFLKGSVEK